MENERLLLVAVSPKGDTQSIEGILTECQQLVQTAGGEVVETVVQAREVIHPKTYIGSGKVIEVQQLLTDQKVDTVLTADDLSPKQLSYLEEILGCKVIDRSLLILDIFANHAHSREGMLQVEVAQLADRLTRLTGQGVAMSRLGAGIGTRGPGEKKIETDRRTIRRRLNHLRQELKELEKQRAVLRKARQKEGLPLISLVGYTNAGKSTLLNQLTKADSLAENKLFATLDTTTRRWLLADGQEVLLTDTVGFIQRLPHHLVEAFHSTLEEIVYADLLIHVVDASHPAASDQQEAVYQTLDKLGAGQIPVLTVFNKIDCSLVIPLIDQRAFDKVSISAKTGQGIEGLVEAVAKKLKEDYLLLEGLITYTEAAKMDIIRRYGHVIKEDFVAEGIVVKAYLEAAYVNKYELTSLVR